MKKLIFVFIFMLFASCANAMNVLQENKKYLLELNSTAAKQYAENPRWMMYYKGNANYTGSLSSGSCRATYNSKGQSAEMSAKKKALYEKKGVKFKVDEAKKEEQLKKLQEKSQQEEKSKSSSSDKTYTQSAEKKELQKTSQVKIEASSHQKENSKPAVPSKHNEDAE